MSSSKVPGLRELSVKALLERISPDMRIELARALDERTKRMLIDERASMREYTIEHKIPDVVVFRFQNDISFADEHEANDVVRAYHYNRPRNVLILFACDRDGNFFHEGYAADDYWSHQLSAKYRGPNTVAVHSGGSPLIWKKINKTCMLIWKYIIRREPHSSIFKFLVSSFPDAITDAQLTFDYDRKLHMAQCGASEDEVDFEENASRRTYNVTIYDMKRFSNNL